MCGRYELNITPARIGKLFNLRHPIEEITPRYNIAPSTQIYTVRLDKEGERKLSTVRWGLIPFWAKDAKFGFKTINARAETVATNASFREPFKKHRCLIPASGFYEWYMRPDGQKQPYHFGMQGGEPFAFAGLWSRWKGPDDVAIDTCTIITTEPNELCAKVHDRMPVILAESDYERWLDVTVPDAQELLCAYPADEMRAYPVSTKVGNVKNDSADLIEPIGTD